MHDLLTHLMEFYCSNYSVREARFFPGFRKGQMVFSLASNGCVGMAFCCCLATK